MPSGYKGTDIPSDIILDSGLLYVGATPWGAAVEPVSIEPTREVRNVEFVGKRSPVAGLDRIFNRNIRLVGSFLEFGTTQLENIMGTTSALVGAIRTFTPRRAGALYTANLSNVKVVFQRGRVGTLGQGTVAINLASAIVTVWSIEGRDASESILHIEIEGRLLNPTNTDAPTYTISLNSGDAANILFRYVPGDSLVGFTGTFTRATAATYFDVAGVMQSAASGALRDAHYLGGVRHTLIEPNRSNYVGNSMAPNNWTLENVTSALVTNIDGANTARQITENSVAGIRHLLYPTMLSGIAGQGTYCMIVKRVNHDMLFFKTSLAATKFTFFNINTLAVVSSTHNNSGIFSLPNGWVMCWCHDTSVAGVTNLEVGLANDAGTSDTYTGTSTRSVIIGGGQFEPTVDPGPTSMIYTVASVVTRAFDTLSFALPWVPQDSTMYVDSTAQIFNINTTSGDKIFLYQGDTTDNIPMMTIGESNTGVYSREVMAATGDSQVAVALAHGDRIEVRGIADNGANKTQAFASKNGAAETPGGVNTAVGAYPPTFGTTPNVYLYPGAHRKAVIMQGPQTQATMRAA